MESISDKFWHLFWKSLGLLQPWDFPCCGTDRASDKLFSQEFDFVGFWWIFSSGSNAAGKFHTHTCWWSSLSPSNFYFRPLVKFCPQDFNYFAKLSLTTLHLTWDSLHVKNHPKNSFHKILSFKKKKLSQKLSGFFGKRCRKVLR